MKKFIYCMLPVLVLVIVLTAVSASVLANEDEVLPVQEENLAQVYEEEENTHEEMDVIVPEVAEEAAEEPSADAPEQTDVVVETEKAETVVEDTESEIPDEVETEEGTSETEEPADPEQTADEQEGETTEEALQEEETVTDAEVVVMELQEVENPDAAKYLNLPMVYADDDGNILTNQSTFALRIPSVIHGHSTSTIVDYGFYGWNQLTVVVIPSNITSIGEQAFAGCGNLSVIVLEGRANTEGMKLGYNWNGGASVVFGMNLEEVPVIVPVDAAFNVTE